MYLGLIRTIYSWSSKIKKKKYQEWDYRYLKRGEKKMQTFSNFILLRYNSHTIKFSILKCTTMVLGIFRKLCNNHHYQIPQHFLYCQINAASVTSHSPFPLRLIHWQPLIYFVSLRLTYLRDFLLWNHIVCHLLCLTF